MGTGRYASASYIDSIVLCLMYFSDCKRNDRAAGSRAAASSTMVVAAWLQLVPGHVGGDKVSRSKPNFLSARAPQCPLRAGSVCGNGSGHRMMA
jgi:hypothetical protein